MAEIELPDPNELQEIKGKSFERKVALVTAVYAVILAITSLGGSNAMKDMILAQQQASDAWAFYQAKVIREHLYRSERMRLELDLVTGADSMKPEAKARMEEARKSMGEDEERYRQEKKDIEKDAKKFEGERDINRVKDPYFDYAEVLLQISIVLSSIAIISSSRGMFLFSAVAAGLGTLLSINGFLLVVRLPFL